MKTLVNWLSNRTTGRAKTANARPSRKLRVESLEDRVVLDAGWATVMQSAFVQSMNADNAGNHFLSGTLSTTQAANFGNITLPLSGLSDFFVAKQNANGQFLWAVKGGNASTGNHSTTAIATDAVGNVYISGTFDGTSPFGSLSLTSAGGRDGFVAKINGANGQFVWAKRWGGAADDTVSNVAVDPSGNVVISGALDTTQNVTSTGFVGKVANDGTDLWMNTVSATAISLYRLAVDSAGSIYAYGGFRGTAEFPTGTLVTGGDPTITTGDGLLTKLDGNGTWLWARSFPTEAGSKVNDLAIRQDGQLYIVGNFAGTTHFDAYTLTNPGTGRVLFAAQIDSVAGGVNWAQQIGVSENQLNDGKIAIDPQGNLNLIGTFRGTAQFGPFALTTDGGLINAFISKVSPTGLFLDAHRFITGTLSGTINISTYLYDIDINATGDVFVGGWFSGGTISAPQQLMTANYLGGFMIMLPPTAATKFFVVDDSYKDRTYQYSANGVLTIDDFSLNTGNVSPRGAASNATGTTVWVGDRNLNVYVYSNTGALQGSWTAGSLSSSAQMEGVATNGTDVWVVDNSKDTVYRYAGAASRLSGTQAATSSFKLNSGNSNPKGIVTDGSFIWVVNDSTTDKVFKYSVAGSYLGSWTIDSSNYSPTGLTIDPTNGSQDIWIVDNGTDKVYQYANGRSRTSGSQAASATFALAVGNTNPQGIADPPTPGTADPVATLLASVAAPTAGSVAAREPSAVPASPLEWLPPSASPSKAGPDAGRATKAFPANSPMAATPSILETGAVSPVRRGNGFQLPATPANENFFGLPMFDAVKL